MGNAKAIYTTQPAESLMGIALRELGHERRWVEIRDLNEDRFSDMGPHDYYPVGTELNMPTDEELACAGPSATEQDLVMLVHRLSSALNKHVAGNTTARAAMDFLTRKGLTVPARTLHQMADLEPANAPAKDPEILRLHQLLAEKTLEASTAWQRLEMSNRMCVGLQEERAALITKSGPQS